jgi:hypothetical protein
MQFISQVQFQEWLSQGPVNVVWESGEQIFSRPGEQVRVVQWSEASPDQASWIEADFILEQD